MSLRINDEAAEFHGRDRNPRHHQLPLVESGTAGAVLFSHPKGLYAGVHSPRLGYMARLAPEFAKRNTKIIELSVDPVS